MTPLISALQLQEQLADVLLIDCRHDLANPEAGRLAYAEGHLPGAYFLHLDDDLSGLKTGANGRHPLPDPQVLADKLADMGMSRSRRVVAYDAQGGMYAARLWWLLRWLGHDHVQVLDGGMAAWQGALVKDLPKPVVAEFVAELRPALMVGVEEVLANIKLPIFTVVDARSPSRFMGEGETMDPVGGHIPGAINRFFQNNLQEDGRFKSAEVLKAEWQQRLAGFDASHTVQQCGSGVTACHNLLALEVAGLSGARLYAGSWSEWCADAARPVA
ncbi:sulfurtransferase [Janthinobacterium sp. B9-8]|uniref:sulfurtransferase n=1 Tax=Janthinobacterium sp. B9-8 TaxID=1236179 RepID=UPI00061D0BF4|nr:sulfurtransferase [Janthinobacterium sp. B9-8]AMC34128.1 3-mercaptopyruvate sulfurtransferase [Janthinobacterium sp. B9-8]